MKIPKYIDELLERRARCADLFISCDNQIADWLEKNDIDVPADDIRTGACSLVEPWNSIEYIRSCIREKEK